MLLTWSNQICGGDDVSNGWLDIDEFRERVEIEGMLTTVLFHPFWPLGKIEFESAH